MKFSYGENQFLLLVTGRNDHPSLSAVFLDKNGNPHYLGKLEQQLDPVTFNKNDALLNAVRKIYGLDDRDTPQSKRNEGAEVYTRMRFRQMINFLELNKKTLSE